MWATDDRCSSQKTSDFVARQHRRQLLRYAHRAHFAERAGIESGDLLMTLGGAPLFTRLCLQANPRAFNSGETLKATWVRGETLQEGEAQL